MIPTIQSMHFQHHNHTAEASHSFFITAPNIHAIAYTLLLYPTSILSMNQAPPLRPHMHNKLPSSSSCLNPTRYKRGKGAAESVLSEKGNFNTTN